MNLYEEWSLYDIGIAMASTLSKMNALIPSIPIDCQEKMEQACDSLNRIIKSLGFNVYISPRENNFSINSQTLYMNLRDISLDIARYILYFPNVPILEDIAYNINFVLDSLDSIKGREHILKRN